MKSKDEPITVSDIQKLKKNQPRDAVSQVTKGVIYSGQRAKYLSKPSEKVIKGEANSAIVLGRDMPNGIGTGTASTGKDESASIELVVGRGEGVPGLKPPVNSFVEQSSYYDAAKIFISQNSNPDKEFGYRGTYPPNSSYSSAFVAKADQVRLFSRGHVVISTRMDQSSSPTEKAGDPSYSNRDYSGVYLAANNSGGLQPLVKGDNLVQFLGNLVDCVMHIQSVIQDFIEHQYQINDLVTYHTHLSNFTATPNPPPLVDKCKIDPIKDALISKCSQKLTDVNSQLTGFRSTYLNANNRKYISSLHNKTN